MPALASPPSSASAREDALCQLEQLISKWQQLCEELAQFVGFELRFTLEACDAQFSLI